MTDHIPVSRLLEISDASALRDGERDHLELCDMCRDLIQAFLNDRYRQHKHPGLNGSEAR